MSSYTEYFCEITNKTFSQKSHIDKHLETKEYKLKCEIKKLELEKLSKKELRELYKTSKIDKIIEKLSCIKKEHINELKIEHSYSNKDTLRDIVHSIHNFLRNNGVGYGMSALKIFNLFYGLKKIEENKHFEKSNLPNFCKFSEIKKKFNENDQIGLNNLLFEVLPELYDKMKEILFTPISETIPANTIKILLDMIDDLVEIEKKNKNCQLTGKIYEYFIGRDATAISELGAYFTDRHITNYIYDSLLKPSLDDKGNVRTFIDMFGGSGGFTLGYMDYLNNNYNINWKNNLNKVNHYDMNLDVVKYVNLEYYCMTGEFPQGKVGERNIDTFNSFCSLFKNKKYHYICTNPPYGGDKIEKTEQVEIMQMIKKEIEQYFKTTYKIKNMKQVSKLELTLLEKNKIKQFDKVCEKLKAIDDHFRSQTVMLSNSSERFKHYAKDNNIDGSKCKDKEAVSFLMMMDMLEEGGTAVGVLKEGIFFDSKYGHLREHLIENFNVTKVVSVDASQFENTTTKTSIVMFSNTGKTEQIDFYDLVIEKEDKTTLEEKEDGTYEMKTFKDRIVDVYDKHLATATYEQLVENEYTLNHKKYNKIVLIANDGYEMVRLGDICEIKNGYAFKKNDFTKNGCKVVKIKDIKDNNVNIENIDSFVKFNKSYENYKLENNDIIITLTGKSGNICNIGFYKNSNNENVFLNQRLCLLRNFKINENYLFTIFNSIGINLLNENSTTGSIQGNLSVNEIKDLQLPIPKTEQKMKQWVDKINKPYNRVIECKEKLKSLEAKVQTDIQELLDNNDTEDVMLGELCELNIGGTPDTNNSSYWNGSNPWVSVSELNNNIILKTKKYITDLAVQNCNTKKISKNSILMSFKLSIGKLAIAGRDLYCNEAIVYFKFNNLIFNKFIYYLFKTINFEKFASGTIGKGNLNLSILKQIKITLPKDRKVLDSLNPLFEEIDDLNEEIPKQEELYNQYIEELRKDAIKDTTVDTSVDKSIDTNTLEEVKPKKSKGKKKNKKKTNDNQKTIEV
jgi:type I restriction enzyme S subunit